MRRGALHRNLGGGLSGSLHPITAKEKGAIVIEINREPTPLTDEISDYLICGSAGEIIPALVEEVKRSS